MWVTEKDTSACGESWKNGGGSKAFFCGVQAVKDSGLLFQLFCTAN